MRFLTTKQKIWFLRKNIKVDGFYSFPPAGFMFYAKPDSDSGAYMDNNPFTKSFAGQFFLVKEIVNGYCKGNFYDRPKGPDFYLSEEELSRRPLLEALILFLILSIPFTIYNWCRGGVEKIEKLKLKQTEKV